MSLPPIADLGPSSKSIEYAKRILDDYDRRERKPLQRALALGSYRPEPVLVATFPALNFGPPELDCFSLEKPPGAASDSPTQSQIQPVRRNKPGSWALLVCTVVSIALLVFGILGLTGVLPMATGWAATMVVLSPVILLIGCCVSCCHKIAKVAYGASKRTSAPETRVYDTAEELSAAVDKAQVTGQVSQVVPVAPQYLNLKRQRNLP